MRTSLYPLTWLGTHQYTVFSTNLPDTTIMLDTITIMQPNSDVLILLSKNGLEVNLDRVD